MHGAWGHWGGWTSCSKSCARGEKIRIRECDNPAPDHGGEDCFGVKQDNENGMNLATFSGGEEIPSGRIAKVVDKFQEAGVHPPRVTEFDFQRVRQTLPTVMDLQEIVHSLSEVLASL